MKDFPSCFGESGVQVVDSSSNAAKSAHNLVTCIYQAQVGYNSYAITLCWSKHLMGQGLNIEIEDSANKCLCKFDVKPWLFSKWKGSKRLEADSAKIEIFWDLSAARFGSGPEPLEGFYVAFLFDREVVLLLGDMNKEAMRKANAGPSPCSAVFVAKKEHIFGKKVHCTRARFCDNGKVHDVAIECETVGPRDPSLEIRIDKKRVLQVKRLCWKFRGNQTILVDGVSIEVFWDVHSWLFGGHVGNAVFMFQSCSSSEKSLPWSSSRELKETQLRSLGFSLVLYAWKSDY
ncbi:uncharacterized protein A4U43_C03F15390 [Asparagus officinalis]|uniref:DUF868 domain-containing protein n=1 Tax=Asparagus officinalis TaxID=4686 RepID=A0A5P1FD44_ASPOF|nr:uncharacterized protein LOC109833760 [Asparagus officinalis]ONK75297.1 uncharacterized protein A4U43_C03F15390 [Asparagus officinalis]